MSQNLFELETIDYIKIRELIFTTWRVGEMKITR